MKNTFKLPIAAIALLVFAASCSKEDTSISSANAGSTELVLPEVDQLGIQADEAFINTEFTGGTETEDFAISNDGIPDQYMVTASTVDDMVSGKRDGNARRMRACLSELELSGEQITKIRVVFGHYEDCNKSIIHRHREAMKNLTDSMNAKLKLLVEALKNGRITKDQFEANVKEMRSRFSTIRIALAEKSRAAMKECYTRMLRGLNQILTERQWKAFVICYKL